MNVNTGLQTIQSSQDIHAMKCPTNRIPVSSPLTGFERRLDAVLLGAPDFGLCPVRPPLRSQGIETCSEQVDNGDMGSTEIELDY